MKEKALMQYGRSRDPKEKLEYKLNEKIGPKKLRNRLEAAQSKAVPSKDALKHLLEPDVFASPIIDDVCLFPKPMTKL